MKGQGKGSAPDSRREHKVRWSGRVISVQPRIRLSRSFDQRSHSYLGYALWLRGKLGDEEAEFSVGIGPRAQAKQALQIGDLVQGASLPVANPRLEPVEYYKTSALEVIERGDRPTDPPPWHGIPPELPIYRERGHRRLAARTFETSCRSCIWGSRMPVELTIDHWNPTQKRYCFETFCYGPKSCPLYRAGPTRKVPGRKGMSWEEEDWVDEEATAHRSMDE